MSAINHKPENNKDKQGYKVPGDGNVPNIPDAPGNKTFEENSFLAEHRTEEDIPGKKFNIGDKAHFESSKEDFVKTVSNSHSGDSEILESKINKKKPDGDR